MKILPEGTKLRSGHYQVPFPFKGASGLVQTLDKHISRQYLRIDSIFPESKLKYDMIFPDGLAKKNIIFQT